MPRIKSKPIKEGEEIVEIKTKRSTLPNAKARSEIMGSDTNRSHLAETIHSVRYAIRRPRVKSNAELEQRIDEYFEMAAERRIPATVEELSLYVGYTSSTLNDWKNGRSCPFHDGEESGVTTSDIVKRALECLHAIDAVMAEMGAINTISYIFRSKNYYNMTDKQEVTISPDTNHAAMTREQIEEMARNLPDATDTDGDVK